MVQKTLLTDQPRRLAQKYLTSLRAHNLPVEYLVLFGSYAKGNPRWDSDLDLAVVSDAYNSPSFDDQLKATDVAVVIDPMIEPHIIGTKELLNPYSSLGNEITQFGIKIDK